MYMQAVLRNESQGIYISLFCKCGPILNDLTQFVGGPLFIKLM